MFWGGRHKERVSFSLHHINSMCRQHGTTFFLGCPRSCRCRQAFSSCRAWGLLSCSSGRLPMVVACLAKHRLLGVQASVVAARGLVVAAHGLSFPVACGIFLGQG